MQKRPCRACRKKFEPKAQTPEQCYCDDERCQRERRRLWQKNKRRSDPDYLENQRRVQRDWTERNSDYWTRHRAQHPECAERNRLKQRERDAKRRKAKSAPAVLAKMDASTSFLPVPSGTYRLIPVQSSQMVLAKMDAWTVEITVLPRS
jgi:hypothetical protein